MQFIDLSIIFFKCNNGKIKKNYICKKQIKKGKIIRDLINLFKKIFSGINDWSKGKEGETIQFFDNPAKTTTIPAQFVKKYGCRVVPVYIERIKNKILKFFSKSNKI